MDENKQDAVKAPDPTQLAKQTGLVNLAQYLMAVDAYNIEGDEAKKMFAMVQTIASMILIDTLRDYEFKDGSKL
jgi:hypothetical protein